MKTKEQNNKKILYFQLKVLENYVFDHTDWFV